MKAVDIDGVSYKVLENLGFQAGYYAVVVEYPNSPTGERVAVKDHGVYKWYTTKVLPFSRPTGQSINE